MPKLSFEYDPDADVLTIEGARYSGDLLRMWGEHGLPVGECFVITAREDGVMALKAVPVGEFVCKWCLEEPGNDGRHPVTDYAFRDSEGQFVCRECAKGANDGPTLDIGRLLKMRDGTGVKRDG